MRYFSLNASLSDSRITQSGLKGREFLKRAVTASLLVNHTKWIERFLHVATSAA